jgi:hypothetical protein
MTTTPLQVLEHIFLAKSTGDKKALYESSLARVWQHVKNANETGLAILTSWRQALPQKENLSRWNGLKGDVRGMGLGFFTVTGHWRECQDPTASYEDCPEDQLVDAVEPSMVVPNMTLEQAKSLGSKYGQDAVLYAGPETDGKVTLFFGSGDTMELGEFSPNTIAQGYSQLKGNKGTFRFEGLEWKAQGLLEVRVFEKFKENFLKKSLDILD